jgi:hypothetical protein
MRLQRVVRRRSSRDFLSVDRLAGLLMGVLVAGVLVLGGAPALGAQERASGVRHGAVARAGPARISEFCDPSPPLGLCPPPFPVPLVSYSLTLTHQSRLTVAASDLVVNPPAVRQPVDLSVDVQVMSGFVLKASCGQQLRIMIATGKRRLVHCQTNVTLSAGRYSLVFSELANGSKLNTSASPSVLASRIRLAWKTASSSRPSRTRPGR